MTLNLHALTLHEGNPKAFFDAPFNAYPDTSAMSRR